jgi:organic radical activating enzyme
VRRIVAAHLAQVFQIAGCNMRCWYCFVDDSVLSVKSEYIEWITVENMVDMFVHEFPSIPILDLSGGQPDLVPEWCLWVMEEIEKRNLKNKVFIWVDDNLTTMDLMEKYLSKEQISYMANFPKHSRVCCFKGFDDVTYKFNIRNRHMHFAEQIDSFRKLYNYGFDIYTYITLTGPEGSADKGKMKNFIKILREININLPLRVIPLEIKEFAVTRGRMNLFFAKALEEQYQAYEFWCELMDEYYTNEEQDMPFEKVNIY